MAGRCFAFTAAAVLVLGGLLGGCSRRPAFTVVWSRTYGPRNIYSAAALDLNGDGYGDLLVGVPGGVEAYFGSSKGLSTRPDWVWHETGGGNAGYCVGSAGHMDGDPYPEIYVSSLAARGRGLVYLFKTGPKGPEDKPWKVLVGPSEGDGFGERVVRAGNLYGDGFDCLAVADYAYAGERGRVYLYHGGPQGPRAVADWSAEGAHKGDWFGYSLCGPGDLDGDGFDDLVIGSKNCNGSCLTWMASVPGLDARRLEAHRAEWAKAALLPRAGRLSVYYGSRLGLSERPGLVMQGETADEMFAYELAPAVGVQGTGRACLLVGSLGWKDRRGRVELLEGRQKGKPLARLWSTQGAYAFEGLGEALSLIPELSPRAGAALLVGSLAEDDAAVYWPLRAPFQMRRTALLSGKPTHKRLSIVLGSAGDLYRDGHCEVFLLIPGTQGKLEVLRFNADE